MDNDGRMLQKKQFVSSKIALFSCIFLMGYVRFFRLNNRRQTRSSTGTRSSLQQTRSTGATN